MMYIPYIILGFTSLGFSDLFQMRGQRFRALTALILGYLAVALTLFCALAFRTPGFAPGPARVALMILGAAGLLLLLYSTIVEIPLYLARTYRRSHGNGARQPGANRIALTRGTYGIVRHPGFLWMVLFSVPAAILYRSAVITLLLVAANLCNLILITMEDTVFFPRIFTNYHIYKQQVPFLLPGRFRGPQDPHH